MTDIDPGLKTILERAVPPADEGSADWDDVLRRAHVSGAGDGNVVRLERRPRRRLWYALAAAVLVTALLVNPAFGVGDRILDWFTGSPAPERVKDELAGMDAPEEVRALFKGPGVRAEEARGVMAVETRRGRAFLWAAPTEAGGWCTYVESETEGGGMGGVSCDIGPPEDDPLVVGSGTDMSGNEPFTLLEGRVEAPISSLRLRFADGSTESVPFVERFFIYEVPAGREPVVLVGRDAEGEIVARETIHSPPDEPPGATEDTGAEGASSFDRKLIEIETSAGARASLWVAAEQASDAGRCYGIRVGNEGAYEGEVCTLRTGRPVSHVADDVRGQKEPLVFLHGFVAPRVASLELRFEDGDAVPLRLVEGFFLYEIPRSHYGEGRLPERFIARDDRGRVIARVPTRSRL